VFWDPFLPLHIARQDDKDPPEDNCPGKEAVGGKMALSEKCL